MRVDISRRGAICRASHPRIVATGAPLHRLGRHHHPCPHQPCRPHPFTHLCPGSMSSRTSAPTDHAAERVPQSARGVAPIVADDSKVMALARGTLAHQLLEYLAGLDAEERRRRAPSLAERLAPELPAEVRAGLCAVVLDVFERPEFAFMFAGNSRAEVRIVGEIDGHSVEGQIDRLIVTDNQVTVIDFKTGSPPSSWEASPESYRMQIADYARLLADAYPGRHIRGALFYIEGPVLLEMDSDSRERFRRIGRPLPSQ